MNSNKIISLDNLNTFKNEIEKEIPSGVDREDLTGRTDWKLDDLNLINQAVNGTIPQYKRYVCYAENYDWVARGTTPMEDSFAFILDVDLIFNQNGFYVIRQDWWQRDGDHYIRYYDTWDNDGWTMWVSQPIANPPHPTNYLRSGTSSATTSNCPSGAWYGQY